MAVDELEKMAEQAEKTLGCSVAFGRRHAGRWWINRYIGDTVDYIDDATLPGVIAKLREWATPPKPATLTIEVPFSWVENRANGGGGLPQYKEQVDAACREAFSPWTQS